MADTEIKKCLIKLIEGDGFYYGYRKLTWALRRGFNLVINKKKVYRLCKELN
ncbi:MAG: transposase, partial [Bacillota bacterium]